jgi:hypothetical protein
MTRLARRAVACKGFRWMPGMRTVRDDGHGFHIGCTVTASKVKPEWLPDLTDPATLGCLLALVREACDDPTIRTQASGPYWIGANQGWCGYEITDEQSTEAHVLVVMLEAAP